MPYITKNIKVILPNIILFVSIAIPCLILGEYFFRQIINQQYRKQINLYKNDLLQPKPNTEYEYLLKPNTQGTYKLNSSYTWSYKINSEGFRGDEIDKEKNPDEKRVIFLGDSYTFGWAINQNETYISRLNNLLNRNKSQRYQLINMGMPGYNTIQEAALLKTKGLKFNPDLIVLEYTINDEEPQHSVPENPNITYKYSNSWLLDYTLEQLNIIFFQNKQIFTTNIQKHDFNYLKGFQPDSHKWRDSKKALFNIIQLGRKNHTPLILIILPDFPSVFRSNYPFYSIHQSIFNWAHEYQIDVIDLQPNFMGKDYQNYTVRGDWHPNAKANEEIAKIIVNSINKILSK